MKREMAKMGILLIFFVAVCSLITPVMPAGLNIAVSPEPAVVNQTLTVIVTDVSNNPVEGALVQYILNEGTPINTFTNESGISTWKPPLTGTLVINAFSDTVLTGTKTVTVIKPVAKQPPTVTVRYPNGGEWIVQGTSVQVSVHATDDVRVENVTFYYSANGGADWNLIEVVTEPTTGTRTDGIWNATWNTTELTPGNEYLIRAIAADSDGLTATDESDATFTVVPTGWVIIKLYTGWNLVSWINATDTTAEGMCAAIGTPCTHVVKWDNQKKEYISYPKGYTTNNFEVTRGYGYWVRVDSDTTWVQIP